MHTECSEELYSRAKELMPGGVNSPVRAFLSVGGTPRFIRRAKEQYLYDEDGNAYIDYIGSWGPMILGHNPDFVLDAVRKQLENGLSYGAATALEVEMAELIHEIVPCVEMMRMVNSGTEAVMSAVRAARGFTGRDKIVKFEGCYHGHADAMLVKAGSGVMTSGIPDSSGVPRGCTADTLSAVYNDLDSVERLFQQYPSEIACVIVEPVAANMGLVLPEEGFLEFLREITKDHDSLLIFDEVITGFRLSLGGAQQYYNIKPDITTLGKIVGGGMPIGAYGGRREIMQMISPDGPVYQAGTLSGNPVATTAGIETLNILKDDPQIYERLENKTKKLANAARQAGNGHVCVNQIGSLMSVFFTDQKVRDFESAVTSNTEQYADYFGYLLDRGIYIAPSQFETMFISDAHTEEDIEKTCKLAGEALCNLDF